jgi:hypothetical protein
MLLLLLLLPLHEIILHSQKLGVKVRIIDRPHPRDVRLFGGKRPYDTWQRVA